MRGKAAAGGSGRSERTLLELLAALAPAGAWCLEVEADRFTVLLQPARQITGHENELELLVREPHRLLHGSSLTLWESSLERALRTGAGWDLMLEVLPGAGVGGWIRTVGRAEMRKDRIVRIYGVVQDAALQHALEHQALELQKAHVLAEVAPVIAELNHLLAAISQFQQAASEALPEWHPAQNDLAGLAGVLEGGTKITGQLLSLAERGSAARSLDLVEVIGDLYPALRQMVGPGIVLDVVHATRLSRVHVDRRRLEQAILAVALRARAAMPGGGTLTLATREATSDREPELNPGAVPAAYVELSIRDTGEPTPGSTRAAPAASSSRPAGEPDPVLGLELAHRFVRAINGHMQVESAPDGTTVRLWLPRATGESGPSA